MGPALELGHRAMAAQVDQPIAALLKDLKARGILDETLVIWAGEFGRTPFFQGSNGRDHNLFGFSIWMSGGGVKGGTICGTTEEDGYYAIENRCTVHDLWATCSTMFSPEPVPFLLRFSAVESGSTRETGKRGPNCRGKYRRRRDKPCFTCNCGRHHIYPQVGTPLPLASSKSCRSYCKP